MKIIRLEWRFWLRAKWLKWVKRAKYRPEETIFFIHIPKTAGTSFRNMLFRLVDQEVAFPNLEDLGQNEGNYPVFEGLEERLQHIKREIRFFTGHYPFVAGEQLPPPVQYYVFLREPFARTISNLRHFQRNFPENRSLSLAEVFENHKDHLQNLQTRFLAISNAEQIKDFYRPKDIADSHLAQAKENLKKCTFIGITERFPESIAIAEKLLGAKLGYQLKRNVAPEGNQTSIEPMLKEKIRHYLKLDLELYQFALQCFDQQQSLILKK